MLSLLEELASYSRRWLTGVLVLGLSLSLPLSLADSRWVPGLSRLVPVALLAAAFGLWAGARARGKWLPLAALLAGLSVAVTAAADAWPLLSGASDRWSDAARRLTWWAQVLWIGGTTDDWLVSLVAAGLIVWGAGFWLGWAVVRHDSALVAVLPAGGILAANTFFSLGGSTYLLAFPPVALLLMAQTRTRRLEMPRPAGDPHFQARLTAGMLVASLVAAGLIAVVSVATPYTAFEGVSRLFWTRAQRPWRQALRFAHWVFPAVGAGDEATSWFADEPSAAMPSARALSGEVVPGSQVVMRVHTSDPAPLSLTDSPWAGRMDLLSSAGPTRYWRGMTYDTYTGAGWANGPLDIVPLAGGQALQQPEGPRQAVTQDVRILVPHGELLYAVADPVRLDVASRPRWRGAGDLAYVNASVGRYSVVSAAPDVSERELRQAGGAYPGWVRTRYLDLTDVPQRVTDLAAEIAADTQTAYDKLVAIESYLRANYTYDLSVPAPASGKDAVEYFLFEAGRGYCDYYASAMVVMARAVGVPARLASGYATGTYDYESAEYVVRESDAHSWPEAYFPHYGWIAFEPTVSQERIYRPSGAVAAALPEIPTPGVETQPRRSGVPLIASAAAAAVSLALAGLVLVRRSRAREMDRVIAAYAVLESGSRYLGMEVSAAWTPREFARYLGRTIAAAEGGSPAGAPRAAAEADVAAIAAAYERGRYGHGLPASAGEAVVAAEVRLRRLLRPLILRRAPAIAIDAIREACRRLRVGRGR